MKRSIRYYIYWFLGFTFTALILACGSGEDRKQITFYNVEKQESLVEKTGDDTLDDTEEPDDFYAEKGRKMNVQVSMQFLESEVEEKKKVCQLINSHLLEILLNQSSEQTIEEAVSQYVEDKKSEFYSSEVANTYYNEVKGIAEYGLKNVLNYRLQEDVFTGGAHPYKLMTILRFDTKTGAFMSLEDVFPTYQQNKLKERLLKKLMEYNRVKTLKELQAKGFLEMTDLFIPSNFALREDSIEFYYNEYDIAPYAYGATTICLGYDDVKDLMNPKMEIHK
ncbi:MAG: DUF3298 domain-containing protein [Bacteroidales bacterium]|nr:DUF3298 domain-containing protein [Bacteroidales bacterium]